jgi:hypothetical protein
MLRKRPLEEQATSFFYFLKYYDTNERIVTVIPKDATNITASSTQSSASSSSISVDEVVSGTEELEYVLTATAGLSIQKQLAWKVLLLLPLVILLPLLLLLLLITLR